MNSIRSAVVACLLAALLDLGLTADSRLAADDLYVSNVDGSDRSDGRMTDSHAAASGPVRSISRALEIARRGDRIVILNTGVPYRECLTMQGPKNSGTDLLPFVIVGNGAILEGTAAVDPARWQHVSGDLFRFQPERVAHQYVYRDGVPMTRSTDAPAAMPPETWSSHSGWIYFRTQPGKSIAEYSLTYARHQVGITLYQVENVVIDGLVIQGFQLDGVNAHDLVRQATVVGCTLRGNGRSGLSVCGASRVTAEACLIGDNYVAQVRTEGFCQLDIRHCDIVESPAFGPPLLNLGGKVRSTPAD